MIRNWLIAGIAAAALTPSLASAQSEGQARCQDQKHDNRVVGTVVGAGLGALLGNAIGQHGGKVGGTVIGGVGGAVAGNAIGASTVNCGSNRYGYYDDNGRWVPNTATAYGYYDADGRWVDTTGPGYAPPPPPTAYNQQPAYDAPPPPSGPYDRAAYDAHDRWGGASLDTRERENRLEQRIEQRMADGALDQGRGRYSLRQLHDIQRMDQAYRNYDGRLSDDQRRDIMARLDSVRESVFADAGGYRSY